MGARQAISMNQIFGISLCFLLMLLKVMQKQTNRISFEPIM